MFMLDLAEEQSAPAWDSDENLCAVASNAVQELR